MLLRQIYCMANNNNFVALLPLPLPLPLLSITLTRVDTSIIIYPSHGGLLFIIIVLILKNRPGLRLLLIVYIFLVAGRNGRNERERPKRKKFQDSNLITILFFEFHSYTRVHTSLLSTRTVPNSLLQNISLL